MNNTSPISVPLSRLRRELNKWMRVIDKDPSIVLFITRNHIKTTAIISPSHHGNFKYFSK